jgi:hypothetical protein
MIQICERAPPQLKQLLREQIRSKGCDRPCNGKERSAGNSEGGSGVSVVIWEVKAVPINSSTRQSSGMLYEDLVLELELEVGLELELEVGLELESLWRIHQTDA